MSKETTETRKKQIIEAVLDIAAERGVSGLTTAEVARRVGFSEAALFRHFPSKMDMLKATVTWVHESLAASVISISKKDIGPLTKLEEILEFQLGFIEKNRGMSRIIFSDELHTGNSELRETVRTLHRRYHEIISFIIQEAVSIGIYRQDLEIEMAARTFFGMIQTAVFNWSISEFSFSLRDQFKPISKFLRGCFLQKFYCR